LISKPLQYTYFILVGVFILLLIISLPDRKPHIDDAWLAEHSYWLLEDGMAKTKLMTGIAGGDERLILHHKLFTIQGAALIALFGFSLSVLKSISLLYLLLLILGLFLIRKNKLWFNSPESFWIALLIFLANPILFEFSFVFRPELMLTFLGFVSSILIINKKDQHISNQDALLSGLVAGLAFSAHLNASIFIAAGFLFLVIKRNWINAFVFAFGSIATSLIYFYDFQSFNDFNLWYHQLTFIPSENNKSGLFLTLLMSIVDEQRRFFHSPKEISFTLLTFFSLLFSWKKLKNEQRDLLIYLLLLMIAMSVLALNKSSKYLIMLMPFLISLLSNGIWTTLQVKNRFRTSMIGVLIAVYLITSMIYNLDLSRKKYDPGINSKISENYAGAKTIKISVIAPMAFIFNEIDKYNRIVSLMSFNERQKLEPDLRGRAFLIKAKKEQIQLMLIPEHYQKKLALDSFSLNDTVAGFTLVENNQDLMVWTTQPDKLPIEKSITSYKKGLFVYYGAFD